MKGDSKKAIDFLKKFAPKGPWTLTCISTDKKSLNTSVFLPGGESRLFDWLEMYNGQRNIYFSVNETRCEITQKAKKEDIVRAGWLHVDIDPPDGVDIKEAQYDILENLTGKLPKGLPKPTLIIYSGGGYQAFWRLETPVEIDCSVEKGEQFELYNKRLEQVFGGDHCFNVDRIMRLPGTVNIPDAKKLKKGRTEALAAVMEFNANSYSLSDFKKAQEVQLEGPTRDTSGSSTVQVNIPGNIERVLDLAELDKWEVSDRLKVIIAQGHHPDQPKEGDNSRSAWLFDCCCGLVRANVPDEVIYSILTDSEWGISSSILENKARAHKYAVRQITRAKEHCQDPHLTIMNDRHAIIGNIGGKCRVIEEIDDDVLHRSRLTLSSFEDLRNRYGHIKIQIGTTEKGVPIMVPLGKYWIEHKMRRQYDTMRFMPQGDKPGVYNLWRGFNVEPRPGDCSLYLDHVFRNVCGGNAPLFDYVIKWMARAVQFPASPGEVAIVIRGGKGAGKGTFARIFGRLFGRHYLQVANPSHLVGNFNSHLRDVILLFADEAFFAGDKRHESVLKMLVTEDSIPIEAKGVDVESYPNYVHLIMASNDPHVIRASGDERRYLVLDMGEGNKQDKKFFSAVGKQMEEGGYEALLYHLQNVDLTDFEVRDVPQTDALKEQKILSMTTEEEWWFRKLQCGLLHESSEMWTGQITTEALTNDYVEYTDKWNVHRRGNETTLGRFLARAVPHLKKFNKRVTRDTNDGDNRYKRTPVMMTMYDFGSLHDCRTAWEQNYGTQEWTNFVVESDESIDVPF